jgi:hypothetical protein
MPDEIPRTFHKVSCPCGQDIRVDPMSQERRVVCRKCGMKVDFVVSIDPRLRKARVSIVVPRDAVKIEGESLAARKSVPEPAPKAPPPPAPRTVAPRSGKTVRVPTGTCACGTSFPVDESELTSIQACPTCGTSYHVVVKLEPGTRKKTVILVPEKPFARKEPPAPKPPPAKASQKTKTIAPPAVPARKGRATVAPTARTRAVPEVPPGAQAVACPCGDYVIVRRRDLKGELPCEACGRSLRFEEVRDPQTLAPRIRVVTDGG